MTSPKRKPSPVYASATATVREGYGHVTIEAYEMLTYRGGTLRIRCQSGGTAPGETYAWEYGVANDYSVLSEEALRRGHLLMRKISRKLKEERDEYGSPTNFADYAMRVLRAAGIRKVHLLPGVNPGYVDVQSLPALNPVRDEELLMGNLRSMELKIIEMASYRECA